MTEEKKDLDKNENSENDFVNAGSQKQAGFFKEFLSFLGETKKWWLLPIIILLLLFGVLVILANSVAAPFIYTLF